MAHVPNSKLALKRQQLIEDNKQLENQNETLKNEIAQAQETLTSLQAGLSEIAQDLDEHKSEKDTLVNDIEQLKTEKADLETEIGIQNDDGEYPEESLKDKKSKLENDIAKLVADGQKRKEEIVSETKQLDEEYQKHKAEVDKNVNIINNVRDFKHETVKNMRFYGWGMILAIIITGVLCGYALYNISATLGLFSDQLAIVSNNLVPNGWNWIYAALSIAIVKIPNALLFVGILAILYKIFGVLFGVYEKINAEKRKISTIEALINHMNEQSVAIILEREIDFKNKKDIENAKSDLKWQILSDYFSKSPVESDNSDSATKRENKVLREIFLNKHKIYGVNTPLGSAHVEEKNDTK